MLFRGFLQMFLLPKLLFSFGLLLASTAAPCVLAADGDPALN